MKYVLKKKNARGQVMSEYAIMLAMFVVISVSAMYLFSALMQNGWRVLALVADEPFD